MKDFGFAKKNPSADSATSAQLMFRHVNACPPWGNLYGRQDEQVVLSEGLSSTTRRPLLDQDKCSSQSFPKVPSVGETNQCLQSKTKIHTGGDETYKEAEGGRVESFMKMASHGLVFPPPQVLVPFHYVDPFFGGFVTAAYRPQAMVPQSQMMAICSDRVPLPFDVKQDDPIYVNAKQYRAILRRRQHRAKQEAQNKINKDRKRYLHESRHLHALRRARGSGGRFLPKKGVQQSPSSPPRNEQSIGKDNQLHTMSNESKSNRDRSITTTTTTSCSDVTTASNNDDIFDFEQPYTGLSAFPSHIIENDHRNFDVAMYGGMMHHFLWHKKRWES